MYFVHVVDGVERCIWIKGTATVFDLQGRYLGTLQTDLQQANALAEILRIKYKASGVYLVQRGIQLKRVNVK